LCRSSVGLGGAASSGSSAQAVTDALFIDADTIVAFGSIPGEVSGTIGTTPDGRVICATHPTTTAQCCREEAE
jgi:hypothetical protein